MPAETQQHTHAQTNPDGPAAPQDASSGAAEVRTSKMASHDRRDKGQNRNVEALGAGTPDLIRTFIKLLLLIMKTKTFLQNNQIHV